MKKQQDHLSDLENGVLPEEEIEIVLDSLEKEEPIKEDPKDNIVPPMRGVIALIIDDFGYRNDHISNGFLELPGNLTYAIIQGMTTVSLFQKRLMMLDMK